jgi:hypothetical protein
MKYILLACVILMPQISLGLNTDQFGKVVGQCDTKDPKKHVWIFKQWHLGPTVNTSQKSEEWPQKANQTAIYKQIKKWVEARNFNTIFSEGCSGEITDKFIPSFNGWNFKSLESKAQSASYDDIVTLIPLKIKAKYKDQVHVFCGDDEGIIKKQGEALSDARGNAGFLRRIKEFHDDSKRAKPYLDKVIELDHLSPDATVDEAIKKLKKDLSEEVSIIKKGIDDRNKSFVSAIKKGPSESALVVGGIHAQGIMDLLKKSGIDCTVIEPMGYRSDDEKAILNFLESDHK